VHLINKMHKEIDRKENRVYGGGMSDAVATGKNKGILPEWLTGAINAMTVGIFRAPSDAIKAGPTHGEVKSDTRGTVAGLLNVGGGFSAAIDITKQGEQMLQTYLQGALKLGWGAIKGTITAAAHGFQEKNLAKAQNATGNAMKSFGGIVKDFFKGAEAVLDPLFFRFLGARGGK
jgi:uncharacterized protein YjbJ (UPF0337 family)